LSIQHMLNLYRIPTRLRVLYDLRLDDAIVRNMENCGCLLFPCDLSGTQLSSEQIKLKTDNVDGIDLTHRDMIDPNNDNYYDWMSYEIINHNARHCFVPFGTGDLFINIVKIAKREHINSLVNRNDSRYMGNVGMLRKTNFYAARTELRGSRLTKLYADYLPSLGAQISYIEECKRVRSCGPGTCLFNVAEEFVDQALELADINNVVCEPSGVAGLALFLQVKDTLQPDSRILIVNTGKAKVCEDIEVGGRMFYRHYAAHVE
jgi:hypothetical protein